jgi:hypothetical protein
MPLSDVRIIAIEQYGAGPFGSVHLADLGAEVIKIEEPSTGGDVGRYVVPEQHGEVNPAIVYTSLSGDYVFSELLGYDESRIERLTGQGVVHPVPASRRERGDE